MAILAALPLIGKIVAPLLGKVFGIVDQMVEDKDAAAKMKAAIQMQMMDIDHKEFMSSLQEQASIIKAEATGHSWLQRNWRPLLMLVCIIIVFNNFVLFPYLSMFTTKVTVLELPVWLWRLMVIGVGGYIGGRTVEKAAPGVVEAMKGVFKK